MYVSALNSSVLSFSSCGQDIDLVRQILEVEDYNIESAIFAIFQVKEVERISKYLEFVTWCFRRVLSDLSVHCNQQFRKLAVGCAAASAFLCSGRLISEGRFNPASEKKTTLFQKVGKKEITDSETASG